MLSDPAIEHLGNKSLTITRTAIAPGGAPAWFGFYTLASGSAPTTKTPFRNLSRLNIEDQPFNSGTGQLYLSGFTAGDCTFYIESSVMLGSRPALPNIVAAIRIANLWNNTLTNLTTCDVSLELVRDPYGSPQVVAESPVRNFLTLAYKDQFQLVAPGLFTTANWGLRLKVHVVATGAGAVLGIDFAEPQLALSYTPDPGSFSPIVGGWVPDQVIGTANPSAARTILAGRLSTDFNVNRLEAGITSSGAGTLHFGPGGSSAPDSRLYRSGAKTLTVDDTAAGAATLNVVGAIQNGGTQVVGARRTGWGAPTGTATRTTFATDTVSLIDLARAVKALIDDLTSHGLIGP